MTTQPDSGPGLLHDGSVLAQLAQILVEQGKQGTQLAVVITKLEAAERAASETKTDHELRLRELERFNAKRAGGSDLLARIVAGVAALAAIAAVVASFWHHR